MHRHAELEVNLVLAGRAECIVSGRRQLLSRGSVLWLFPAQDHLLISESTGFEMWIGVFAPRLTRSVAAASGDARLRRADPEGDFCRSLTMATCGRLASLFHEVREAGRRRRCGLANAALRHLLLAAWHATEDAPEQEARSVHPAVLQAADLIGRHPESTLDLPTLAHRVGLSPSRLSHLFRTEIGIPLATFRSRQRLDRFLDLASKRLRTDLLSLALEAGFGSYPQFHRVFKRVMGRSPRDHFRERGR
ncbi:MAG: helix-turn-helix domain-containing protein [Phycisphaeraceae bacterium]|nr:helix-turn-helix domain-containing protein [Phycisphaeraceae bacterium]